MKPFTPNSSDRELDDLFRKVAAESASARAGREGAARKEAVWKKLEAKLDASSRHPSRRFGWWILLLALLLTGATGFLIWKNAGIKEEQPSQQMVKAPTEESVAPPVSENGINKKTVREGTPYNSQKEKPAQGVGAVIAPSSAQHGTSGGSEYSQTSYSAQKEKTEEVQKGMGNETTTPRHQQLSYLPYDFRKIIPVTLKDTFALLANVNPDATITTDDTTVPEFQQKEKEARGTFPKWSVGFTAGPDWSGMKSGAWKTGLNGGLKVTYRFSKKWAVSTGILLAKKLYDAPPGGYHPADSGWQNYDVKQINAQCIVLDVPLNIAYTLWNHEGNHIFLSTGLSSFWMKEEEYTYHYKTPAGAWKQWTKEMYNQNHHLFSILNFSAGYQKDWQHFSLQVAPYLKVPLQGIGYGNVQLYGAGVHFTLQYGLK